MNDFRDWFILLLVSGAWIASTAYLFMFHSDANFAIWGGITTTITGAYHFLVIKDSKQADATC